MSQMKDWRVCLSQVKNIGDFNEIIQKKKTSVDGLEAITLFFPVNG